MLHDVRDALLGFGRNPSFTAVVIACLALGIAADTAVWSIFDATLLRPLPFHAPDELVSVRARDARTGRGVPFPYAAFVDLAAEPGPLGAVAAWKGRTRALTDDDGAAELASVPAVSSGLFALLGVAPRLGRGPSAREDRPGAGPIVVISDGLWTRRYGRDPDVVGRTLRLDARSHEVVGVMPPGFAYPSSSDAWIALGADVEPGIAGGGAVSVIGRLTPGTAIGGARVALSARGPGLVADLVPDPGTWEVAVRPLGAASVGQEERQVTTAMMGAVSFLLLLASANVASLLLVRATTREREFAIRTALGSSRTRLVRRVVVEALLLALAGAALALPLASWALRRFASSIPPSDGFPWYVTFGLDGRALAYTLAVAVLTGLLFGIAPALVATRTDPGRALQAAARSGGSGRRATRVLSAFVVVEIALAATLLVGGSLFGRVFFSLDNVDLGYPTSRIMTLRFYLPGPAYDAPDARLRAVHSIQERLAAIPGVEHAAISDLIPLEDDGGSTDEVVVDGMPQPERNPRIFWAGVAGDWLGTLDVETIAGRDFEPSELRTGTRVAVVNRTLADAFWPGRAATGRTFRFAEDTATGPYTVVGVIPDVRTVKLDEDEGTPPTAFVPLDRLDTRDYGVLLRTALPPAALADDARSAIASVDPDVPTHKVWPMDRVKWLSFWMYGLWGATFGAFGAVAVVLAAIGVYGVIAFGVRERRHEIGVRMALGARRGGVIALVTGRAARLAGAGAALGVVGGLLVGRVIESLLIGVSATDLPTYAGVVAFLWLVAVGASLLPAWRAAAVDPARSLRS